MQYATIVLKLLLVPIGLAGLMIASMQEAHLDMVGADPGSIAMALLVNQLALLLFAARMRFVLAIFGITLGLAQALRVHLQSVFYFFVLPMTVGLEIARFAKIRALARGRLHGAALAYALLGDRILGALASLLIALALLPLVEFRGLVQWEGAAYAVAGATLTLLLVALLFHARVREHARRLAEALRARRGRTLGCLAMALLTHACFALAVHVAARGTNIDITPLQTAFAVSASMLFVAIPVSFAGVSPVEAASLGVLVGMGLPVEQAAVFAVIVYLAKLAAALEGGAWEVIEGGDQLRRVLSDRGRDGR